MRQKLLRSGYTTGTCAAAAAKAAAVFLLTKAAPEAVSITTPQGSIARLAAEPSDAAGYPIYFRVQKDAGDDPDVTHGSWIYATVKTVTDGQWEQLWREGAGYIDENYPGIYLTGGTGVGIVTRRGLACPVGKYAINPVPRQMIFQAVAEVKAASQTAIFLAVEIMIPNGERLAAKTFNPKLGIEGGISILGTTGIVEPMSEHALTATIRLEIRMQLLEKKQPIIITPGNYGETFLRETLNIPLGEAVKCSNFIADTMTILCEEGADMALLVGHIGKLVKVSGGAGNTHSRYGDRRMELLAAAAAGIVPSLIPGILGCNTTEEAMGLIVGAGAQIPVLNEVAGRVQRQLKIWTGGRPEMEVVTFSSAYGILGMTERAEWMLKLRQGGRPA